MAGLRTPLAVLNDLSLGHQMAPDEALSQLGSFGQLLRACRAVRPDIGLVSPISLTDHPMTSEGRTLGEAAQAAGGRSIEEWRLVRQALSRAPFRVVPEYSLAADAEEYQFEGEEARAIGFAASASQLIVSFPDQRWNTDQLQCARVWLREDEAGEIVERSESVSVPHAMTPAHVVVHEGWIRRLALPSPYAAEDLWADRKNQYPLLGFLASVERDLRSFARSGSSMLRQIDDRLREIDRSCAEWSGSAAHAPTWRSLITPEHEQRKQFCVFKDLDGEERCFDLHARLTPGKGRIHLRLTARGATPQAVIAYIGPKLGPDGS